ncbi:MAG: hypothetical protein GQ574_05805 [Crocinitomix sp.]|nr:hypothetical protein [Crocinitomix sp.]
MKHAKATKVTIDMISENDQLSLSIADNGKGMGENQSDGFGLKSIKKRIKSLRGKLEILGADGVFLKIQFPLKTVIESS